MGRLRDWWQRLTGGSHESPPKPPPAKAREPEPPPADGLELADDDRRNRPSRTGAAGFDPYASDAGYSKPHSWERVDHD
jgi:hypothetical protein